MSEELFQIEAKYPCIFSDDRRYRYSLKASTEIESSLTGRKTIVVFIGLNPSTADEQKLDPTLRRCLDFARRWKYNSIFMLNLFAFRATDPEEMKAAADPIGPANDATLAVTCKMADLVVASWGNHGAFRGRDEEVRDRLRSMGVALYRLAETNSGAPKHPLARGIHRIPATAVPLRWD